MKLLEYVRTVDGNMVRAPTARQWQSIAHALSVAGNQFMQDAKTMVAEAKKRPDDAPGLLRVAKQFERQALEANELADELAT